MRVAIFLIASLLSACSLATTNQPAEQVRNFYNYYLSKFSALPPDYRDPELQRYVSENTLNRLHSVIAVPEQEIVTSDYFTYTQDYDPAWIPALKIGDVHDKQGYKIVDVYLGIEDGKHLHLEACLEQDSGVWKIARIRDVTNNYEQKIFTK
ncbi:DUF3828 domain-containing protein [Morganella morganii subsp. morganii]|uniref:DUF3828 domain-containing protein n=1 Tax=Morganella morganii TaxID=582 RepID=UPI001BD919AB|nr:DUF3828 domain-containing protein [Morganella morganii]MBT0394301.1 DUF3828 domain-containing protein [Morganella morganii subsp. morganii]